jgi:hypothetical protein
MSFKQTIFSVEIDGEEYKFAALTMRGAEKMAEAEAKAGDDPVALKKINVEMIADAMRKGGMEVTAEDILENMPLPVYRSLLAAFLTAQGVKLEAKQKGEVPLS